MYSIALIDVSTLELPAFVILGEFRVLFDTYAEYVAYVGLASPFLGSRSHFCPALNSLEIPYSLFLKLICLFLHRFPCLLIGPEFGAVDRSRHHSIVGQPANGL